MSCRNCPHGSYNALSDVCDGCRNDPNTGWSGFTDHMLGRSFYTEKERTSYLETLSDDDDDYF